MNLEFFLYHHEEHIKKLYPKSHIEIAVLVVYLREQFCIS